MLPGAQYSILQTLRHRPKARFTDLMQPTGLTSDTFKFHVRRLLALGYVEKTPQGTYQLTPRGKETANNFDSQQKTTLKQPKLSMLIVASRMHDGTERFLFQQRKRSPYFGFWSCIGGPVPWGESIEYAAQRELQKQTNLTATMQIRAFYRKRDYSVLTNSLLEDKLFVVIEAANTQGTLAHSWPHGYNQWMTLDEFEDLPKHFSSVSEAISLVRSGNAYIAQDVFYTPDEY